MRVAVPVRVSTLEELNAAPMFSYIMWAGDIVAAADEDPWDLFECDGWDDSSDRELDRLGVVADDLAVMRIDDLADDDFTDDDAMLAALRTGALFVKVPDSIDSPSWRLYSSGYLERDWVDE